MEPEVAECFFEDAVCVRGIAEEKPIPVYITDDVEITDADREPISRSRRTYGVATDMSLAEVREHDSYDFYLPRAPRRYENAIVYLQFPSFDKQGKRTDSVSHLTIPGREVEEHPDCAVVHISLKRVQDRLKGAPATMTTKFLGLTKTTWITFTPFLEPKADLPAK